MISALGSKKGLRDAGKYGSVGIEFVANLAVGFWVGKKLDARFGTKYLVLVFSLVGVYAAFRGLFVTAKKMQADADRLDREEKEAREARIDAADAEAVLASRDAEGDR